ncbi:MAG TPA: alpha/beta hydrolase [Streptosporangiaceae bacterium]|nr:alpha/beta hydrolase [Streptosporangiaceae bacterium]
MHLSCATDGFRLAYDRYGQGPPVLLLHGWPGERGDWREVIRRLDGLDVIVPDLRGFGQSDKHRADPATAYSAAAQARSLVALIGELDLSGLVIGGYDIGSRIAQAVAADRPELLRGLVVAPPLPGIGARILDASAQREFWYQSFHQLDLAEQLIDGRPDAVLAYLAHFWSHWSGPSFELSAEALGRVAGLYSAPGAFVASIGWYRAGAGSVARSLAEHPPPPSGRVHVPTTVLWPGHDPLFPVQWSDRLGEFFDHVRLRMLPAAGHFSPLEAPDEFAEEIRAAVG